MKKLLMLLASLILAASLFVGCDSIPEVPVVPETPEVYEGVGELVCEGGQYRIHYQEWSYTNCPGESYLAGTYWQNANGKEFLVSIETPFDPNSNTEAVDYFGECPKSYIKIIEIY